MNNSRGNQGRRGRSDRGGAARRYNSERYRPYVTCSYCTKDWHTHEECRKRKRDELLEKSRQDNAAVAITPPIQNSSQNGAKSNNEASGPKRDHSFISNSTSFTSRRSQDWFADSGTTQHMTDQRKFFKSYSLKHMVRERYKWRSTLGTWLWQHRVHSIDGRNEADSINRNSFVCS